MKKKLLTLLIGVSVVVALVTVPLMTACAPEEVAPEVPEAPEEPEAPPETIKLGILTALTGPAAPWGLPGLYGCEIWVDKVNAAGGIEVDGKKLLVEFFSYDDEYTATKALTGAKKLVLEDDVSFIVTMGGWAVTAGGPFLTEQKIPFSTLTFPDVSPEWPYLIAASELTALADLAAYDYVARTNPEASTVAICNPNDLGGWYFMPYAKAAFESAGVEVVYSEFWDPETVDFAPVMTAMLATNPDILCFDASYSYAMHLLTEEAYLQGYTGLMCGATADLYPELIAKTSAEFMEGFVWVFPDFDDPLLNTEQNEFYAEYEKLYPGTWGTVSWEYAAGFEVWKYGIEKAGSIDPMTVFAALKAEPQVPHEFGMGTWWGAELEGIDNILVADWPIVQMHNGKATIIEFTDLLDAYDKCSELLISYLEETGQMWYQE